MKITRKQIRKIAFKLLTEAKTITGDPDLEKKLRKHVGGRQGLTGNPIFQMAKRGSLDQGKGKIDPLINTGKQVQNIHKKIKTSNKDIDRDAMEIYLKRYNLLVNKKKKMKPGEAERKAYAYMQSQYAKKEKPKEDDEGNFLDDPPSKKEKGEKEDAIKPKPKRKKSKPNENVKDLQDKLNDADESEVLEATDYEGKNLDEDGIYGGRTRSAIGMLLQDPDFKEALTRDDSDTQLELPSNYDAMAEKCSTSKRGPGKSEWIKLTNEIAELNGIEGDKYEKLTFIIDIALENLGEDDESQEETPPQDDDSQEEPPPQDDDSQEEKEKISDEKKAMLIAINISEQIADFWSGVGNATTKPFTDENLRRLGGEHARYIGKIKGYINDDEAQAQKYYQEVLFETDYKESLDDLAKLGKLGKALAFFFREDLKFEIGKSINSASPPDLNWSMPPKDIDKSLIPDGLLSDPEIENSQQKFTIKGAFFDI